MADDKKSLIRSALQQKILEVCDRKIAEKGPKVGLSFYAFFANKNDDPELLMEAAEWWIKTHQFDHFEKATKVRAAAVALSTCAARD
ncbi:DUF6500 family protein [Burkholderia sp. DN3021]|uniref:DUF6500 family protein n=1 Tax=Burkholderia sp. DN3021 TaxID=3410137 RepID=UPI003C7B7C7A